MPDPKSKTKLHLVRYKPGNAEEFMPLVIYGDLETCSDPAPTEAIAVHTPCVQKRVASAAFRAVAQRLRGAVRGAGLPDQKAEDGERAAVKENLCRMLCAARHYDYSKKTVNVPANPTEEQLREHEARQRCEMCEHEARQRCEMCEDKFVKGEKKKGKVMHHRRGAGDYIASAASSATTEATTSSSCSAPSPACATSPIPSNEDDAEDDDESEDKEHGDVPQVSLEEWMSEEVDFKKLRFKVLFKTGEKLLQLSLHNLVFSANFYNTSLEKLRTIWPRPPRAATSRPCSPSSPRRAPSSAPRPSRPSARRACAPTSPRRRTTAVSGTTDAGPGSCCCASCPCPSST